MINFFVKAIINRNILKIVDDIVIMLTANIKVFLDEKVQHCYLSSIESKFVELTIGCNLKNMVHHSHSSESLN
jgi:hypothetical protein